MYNQESRNKPISKKNGNLATVFIAGDPLEQSQLSCILLIIQHLEVGYTTVTQRTQSVLQLV